MFVNFGLKHNKRKYIAKLNTSVKKTGVTDDFITRDKTEYISDALTEVVDGINRNDLVLGTISRTDK